MRQLRDIRTDLEARLKEVASDIAAEQERHQTVVAQLNRRKQLLKEMLEDEERQWYGLQPSLFQTRASDEGVATRSSPLTASVCEIMADGQEWSVDRLVKEVEARGCSFQGKNPRRSLHFTLLGLKNKGAAEMPASRRWRLRVADEARDRERGEPPALEG